MQKLITIFVGLLAVFTADAMHSVRAEDNERYEYTSLIARPTISAATAVLGTDGKYHVAYELIIQNASGLLRATLTSVDVLSRDEEDRTLVTLTGQQLREHLFGLAGGPAETLNIPVNGGRLLAINLTFNSVEEIPETVVHRISAVGASNPASQEPVDLRFVIATLALTSPQQLVIGPPLKGKGWVAVNGCCELGFPHRMSVLPIDGRLVISQRFAIDWMRLNDNGRLVEGPIDNVTSWTGYGAEVYAVADGTVIQVTNTVDDQVPGTLPDPKKMTLETVDGNGVVINLGSGVYVFYAHMLKGSVKVKVGDQVMQGDPIGLLGNSGNTSAPHLHVHVMAGRSPLADGGLPYLIDTFELAGQVDRQAFIDSDDLTEDFGVGRTKDPRLMRNIYPLQLNIIDFPE